MKNRWCALPILLLCITACASAGEKKTSAPPPNTIPDAILMEDDHYRVTLVDGWKVVEEDHTVIAYAADNGAALNVSYEDNHSGQTLDNYAQYSVDMVQQTSGVNDIALEKGYKVNDYEAVRLTYPSSPGRLVQYLISDGGKFFTISCMDNNSNHTVELQAILASFTVKK